MGKEKEDRKVYYLVLYSDFKRAFASPMALFTSYEKAVGYIKKIYPNFIYHGAKDFVGEYWSNEDESEIIEIEEMEVEG